MNFSHTTTFYCEAEFLRALRRLVIEITVCSLYWIWCPRSIVWPAPTNSHLCHTISGAFGKLFQILKILQHVLVDKLLICFRWNLHNPLILILNQECLDLYSSKMPE